MESTKLAKDEKKEEPKGKPKRILFVVDKTSSMRAYFTSLLHSLYEIFVMADLTQSIEIGMVLYGDYDSEGKTNERVIDVLPWTVDTNQLLNHVKNIKLTWGADQPEATLTAMHTVLTLADESTPVIHYTDAPPHHSTNQDKSTEWNNYPKEMKYLKKNGLATDWNEVCRLFAERKIQVYTLLNNDDYNIASFHVKMGPTVCIKKELSPGHEVSTTISKITLGIILQIMGLSFNHEIRQTTIYQSTFGSGRITTGLGLQHTQLLPVSVYPHLQTNASSVIQQFRTDPVYREKVYKAFMDLFVPEHVLCMTTNDLFGKLWREICKQRDDSRRTVLMDKLSQCCSTGLKNINEQKELQKWIDDSYDNTEAISQFLTTVRDKYPCLILNVPTSKLLSRKAIQNIARTTCSGEDLAQIMDFISNIELLSGPGPEGKAGDKGDEKASDMKDLIYLPLNVDNSDLFRLLPHLICPGTEFSLRPAAIIALLAMRSNNAFLCKRAEEYLESIRGKWINVSDPDKWPENFSYQFVLLVHKAPQFLTTEENELYNKLYRIVRLKSNLKKKLPVRVGYTPTLDTPIPDLRSTCNGCQQWRSFTLLTREDNICGMCMYGKTDLVDKLSLDTQHTHSRMTRCRTCKAIYSLITDPSKVTVEPACHYCRMNTGKAVPPNCNRQDFLYGAQPLHHGENGKMILPPTVTCNMCRNDFICPRKDDLLPKTIAFFVCNVCQQRGSACTQEVDVCLADLVKENPVIADYLGIEKDSWNHLNGTASLIKLKDLVKWKQQNENIYRLDEGKQTVPVVALHYNKLKIVDPLSLLKLIDQEVKTGYVTDECSLCFSTLPFHKLYAACGKCKQTICEFCAKQWYSQTGPGKMVLPPHLLCPFCKQLPTLKVVRRYNKELCYLLQGDQNVFDPHWYYAWCTKCYGCRPYMERVCAGGDVPELEQPFVCSDCIDIDFTKLNIKKCPHCKAPTVKASGCNHITCSQCGTHWCYLCENQFTATTIYNHMRQVHGGIFGGGDANLDQNQPRVRPRVRVNDNYGSDDDDDGGNWWFE